MYARQTETILRLFAPHHAGIIPDRFDADGGLRETKKEGGAVERRIKAPAPPTSIKLFRPWKIHRRVR